MISSITLTRNDARTIHRCLESLAWCDERIVIDDASTDGTADMAKSLGAKVYVRDLGDDFAAQRNFGLEKASCDWVIFVDSDEVVSPELAREIQEAVASAGKSGYLIPRRDTLFGRTLRFGETGNMKLLRLARKDSGRFVRPVHEVWDVKGGIGKLRHHFDHFPHQTIGDFLDEVNRYSGLNAEYFRSQGVRVSWWQIPAYPVGKFLQNYIGKLGFLDGMPGLIVAIFMSFHSFLTRGKLYLLNRQND